MIVINESLLTCSPLVAANRMGRLVDVLLPGDDLFPAASLVGTHGTVLGRLRDQVGYVQLNDLLERVASLDNDADEQAIATVSALEIGHPVLFAMVRSVTYFSYYASPLVVDAIRRLGHIYNDSPQPLGYALRVFDPTPGVDLPLNPHGKYKATHEISRIDLSALPDLSLDQRT